MKKSPKELAFLRDQFLAGEWTEKFTNFLDKTLKFPKEGKFLYFNAATGNHLLALRERFDDKKVEITATFDNEELQKIAQAKADIVRAKIDFADEADLSEEGFDYVVADLSLTEPSAIAANLQKLYRLVKSSGEIAFFAPTAGSFGEFYSYLWETLAALDLMEKASGVEELITRLPTVSTLEETARGVGLKEIEAAVSREVFEYAKAEEFLDSPLAREFFFPVWFKFLSTAETAKVLKKFPKIAAEDLDGLTFRFSVKATIVEGRKP